MWERRCFHPKNTLIPTHVTILFKRFQFPLDLSFAMSINKYQGETFSVAGIHIEKPQFSYRQIHDAC